MHLLCEIKEIIVAYLQDFFTFVAENGITLLIYRIIV